MDKYSHISNHLSKVLHYIRKPEVYRKLDWKIAMIYEIIYSILQQLLSHKKSSVYVHLFGSCSESTTILGSDVDFIMCHDDKAVIEDISQEKFYKCNSWYLIVQDKTTKPGYVKLQQVFSQMPAKQISQHEEKDNLGVLKQPNDTVAFTVCTQYFKKERNGPAITITFNAIPSDNVYGLRCDKIPTFTRGWIDRKRPYGWPSKQLLDKMSTYGCFFVGVGHPSSPDKDLEWRISFSLQERELMVRLNPTQHNCYILLKMIKKDIIEPQVGKSISSYHCKTSLFYTIENTSTDTWIPENLIECVQLCLTQLLFWLTEENCPNYFIPDENMFDRLHSDSMKQAASVIQTILDNGCDFIGSLSFNIGLLTYQSLSGQLIYKSEDHSPVKNLPYILRRHLYYYVLACILLYFDTNKTEDHILLLENRLIVLEETETVTGHTAEEVELVTSTLISYICLHIAQYNAALLSGEQNEDHNKQRLRSFEYHIKKAEKGYLISAKLVQATLSFKLQKLDACEQFLQQSEIKVTGDTVIVCGCFQPSTHIPNITTVTVECMIFNPSQESFVPEALIFEKYRSVQDIYLNCISVDTKVYFYFLQYLLCSTRNHQTKKQSAINSLYRVLQTDKNLGHRETGYNLLGWIYMTEDKPLTAMLCFLMSWWIRPHHNAAKWHALVLIYKSQH